MIKSLISKWARSRWCLYPATFLGLFVLYWGSLGGPYFFDDLQAFGGNLDDVPLPAPTHWLLPQSRPFLQLIFSGLCEIETPANVVYRVFGLVVHWIAAWLAYLLIRDSLRRIRPDAKMADANSIQPFAAVVAILWAIHPVNVQAVASIVQQAETLVSVAMLAYLCILSRIKDHPTVLQIVGLYTLLFVGAETKIVMLAIIPVGWLWDSMVQRRSLRSTFLWHWKIHAVPLALGLVLAVSFIPMLVRADGGVGFGGDAPPPLIYFATQVQTLLFYLSRIVWPVGLAIDYEPAFITRPSEIWIPVVHSFGYIALAFWFWFGSPNTSSERRLWATLMLVPLILLSPTSSLIPTADPVYLHRIYLAGLFWIWGLATLVQRQINHHLVSNLQRTTSWGTIGLAIVLLSTLTLRRAMDYQSVQTLWRGALLVSPNNARAAQNYVGSLGQQTPETEVLRSLLEIRRQLNVSNARTIAIDHQIAKSEMRMGNFSRAEPLLRKIIALDQKSPMPLTDRRRREHGERWFDLALALRQSNLPNEAAKAIEQCLSLTPNEPFAHALAAEIYRDMGDQRLSEMHARRSERILSLLSPPH